MKRQIRQGVFETNSSSTHAICISKDHDTSNLKLPDSVSFKHGEFGWECEKLRFVWEKASYLYEAILGTYYENGSEEKMDQIKEILSRHGIACDFEPGTREYWNDGYIDHVGEDDMPEWLENMMNDEDALLTYLFGDAFVVTGNDNGYGFSDIMYENLGDKKTSYGVFPRYGGYREEYNNYDIYYKGN